MGTFECNLSGRDPLSVPLCVYTDSAGAHLMRVYENLFDVSVGIVAHRCHELSLGLKGKECNPKEDMWQRQPATFFRDSSHFFENRRLSRGESGGRLLSTAARRRRSPRSVGWGYLLLSCRRSSEGSGVVTVVNEPKDQERWARRRSSVTALEDHLRLFVSASINARPMVGCAVSLPGRLGSPRN
jgi:hypothetical protein